MDIKKIELERVYNREPAVITPWQVSLNIEFDDPMEAQHFMRKMVQLTIEHDIEVRSAKG